MTVEQRVKIRRNKTLHEFGKIERKKDCLMCKVRDGVEYCRGMEKFICEKEVCQFYKKRKIR